MSGQLVPEAGGPVASPWAFPCGSPGESGEVSSARLPSLQFWQLYNAVTLFELSSHEECREWQVWGVHACVCMYHRNGGGPGEGWVRLGRIITPSVRPCCPDLSATGALETMGGNSGGQEAPRWSENPKEVHPIECYGDAGRRPLPPPPRPCLTPRTPCLHPVGPGLCLPLAEPCNLWVTCAEGVLRSRGGVGPSGGELLRAGSLCFPSLLLSPPLRCSCWRSRSWSSSSAIS